MNATWLSAVPALAVQWLLVGTRDLGPEKKKGFYATLSVLFFFRPKSRCRAFTLTTTTSRRRTCVGKGKGKGGGTEDTGTRARAAAARNQMRKVEFPVFWDRSDPRLCVKKPLGWVGIHPSPLPQ
ncbi:hypothetical protein F5888DRAFT_288659 [Russula emetica]|nr:hypothetical protein F5888DRAFT_288659 [Russula emetica]